MFDKIIGQDNAKSLLKLSIDAAVARDTSVGHILLSGPAGTGKTTFAKEIANTLQKKCIIAFAPNIRNSDELLSVILNLNEGEVLFIDEIHALHVKAAETLYTAMEEFKVHMIVSNQAITVPTVPFTLVGATTLPGLIPKPLLSRFRLVVPLADYSETELKQIVAQTVNGLNFAITDEATQDVARRSRGSVRLIKNFVNSIIDYTVTTHTELVTIKETDTAFRMLGISQNGLTPGELKLLKVLAAEYADKAVGVETLAGIMNEDLDSFKSMYEPYLLRQGYLSKTSGGRILTERGAHVIDTEDK